MENFKVEVKQEIEKTCLSLTFQLPKPQIIPKKEPKDNFECQKCNRVFKSKKSLVAHQCSICQTCGRKFFSMQTLQRHIEALHNQKKDLRKFECDACDYKTKDKQSFTLHVIEEHSKEEIKFDCDQCWRKYRCKRSLAMHLLSHKKVQCLICEKLIFYVGLKYHLEFHKTETPFICKFCEKAFKTKRCVENHEKTHKKEFKCKVCDRKFSLRSDLKQHLEFHADKNAFFCDICQKSFTNRHNMLHHNRKFHKNGHRCSWASCNFSSPLTDKKEIQEHRKIHFATKFVCEICRKEYKSRRSLQTHIKNHCKKSNKQR
jgi:KRAB domain-containing zinc finger protein